jgi:Protein of unknown function (DUF938)
MNQITANDKRVAPATARNRDAIRAVLASVLPRTGTVLEVASGSGEHVVYFAGLMPALQWQPSDPQAEARHSIAAYSAEAAAPNIAAPLDIDAVAEVWPIEKTDALLCINMVHISPWPATLGLLRGAARVLPAGAPLYLYGPYRRAGVVTAPSNEAFDQSLRSRDPAWGLRKLEDVIDAAAQVGLHFTEVIEMPANNISVIFRRQP